ncbi:hypothetical protein J6590_067960 [Homalodisca vitripennis]|nr:hypothetical protein J6590_067960 [Homalodisca vitripennis]
MATKSRNCHNQGMSHQQYTRGQHQLMCGSADTAQRWLYHTLDQHPYEEIKSVSDNESQNELISSIHIRATLTQTTKKRKGSPVILVERATVPLINALLAGMAISLTAGRYQG